MNSGNANIILRDKSIAKIQQGKLQFNNGDTYEKKRDAYKIYYSGLEDLIECSQRETNEFIVQQLQQIINQQQAEAQNMVAHLQSIQPQETNNTGNNFNKAPSGGDSAAPNHHNNDHDKIPNKEEDKENQENKEFENMLNEAILSEKPNIRWTDVAGLEGAQAALNQAVILPIKFPEIFTGARQPWRGILLYGPPGTGKTFLAQACATECNATFFSISSSDLISKWVGQSEKLIKTLFKMAREKQPSVIFIDEVDSMTGNRGEGENESSRRVKTEFLVQMQGVGNDMNGVLVLGATNLPWALDPAIRRRFQKRIMIPLPEAPARKSLITNLLKKTPNSLTEDDIDSIAERTAGFSGADVSILVRDAAYQPLRICQNATKFKQIMVGNEIQYTPCQPSDPQGQFKNYLELSANTLYLPDVSADDFEQALVKCKPSVGIEDIKQQVDWTQEFGEEG